MKFIVLQVNYDARPMQDPVIDPHTVLQRGGPCVLGSMYLHRNQCVSRRRVLCMFSLFNPKHISGRLDVL